MPLHSPVFFLMSMLCLDAMLLFLLTPVWRDRVDWASPCMVD